MTAQRRISPRATRASPLRLSTAFAALLPRGPDRLALDVGAGSGRDAAWLAALGFEVVAVEPARGMRREARARHPGAAICWLDDRLPALDHVHRLGLGFDLILVSAVWMHVAPTERGRAFRKLSTLLKPGGMLLISLRDGPLEPDRHPLAKNVEIYVHWLHCSQFFFETEEIPVISRKHQFAASRKYLRWPDIRGLRRTDK